MQTCSHCGREVDEQKNFCAYCGYRIKGQSISKKEIEKPKESKKSKDQKKQIITIVIIAVIILSIVAIEVFIIMSRAPEELDTDNDGIPDSEDDYPKDKEFSAKLDIVESNWFRQDKNVTVVFQFKNNKQFDIYWVEMIIGLQNEAGEVFKSIDNVLFSKNILKPDESAFTSWTLEDNAGITAGFIVEIKGEHRGNRDPFIRPEVTLLTHEGEFINSSNESSLSKYVITGHLRNDDELDQYINLWAVFYDKSGKLLDVDFVTIYIPEGEVTSDFIIMSDMPEADKIENYELYLVFELI